MGHWIGTCNLALSTMMSPSPMKCISFSKFYSILGPMKLGLSHVSAASSKVESGHKHVSASKTHKGHEFNLQLYLRSVFDRWVYFRSAFNQNMPLDNTFNLFIERPRESSLDLGRGAGLMKQDKLYLSPIMAWRRGCKCLMTHQIIPHLVSQSLGLKIAHCC